MNSNKRGLVIFIIMLLITTIAAGLFGGERSRIISRPGLMGDYIAVVNVVGTIEAAGTTYDQQWFLDTIDELENDPSNQGILLYIDSPGGTVYESDEAYLRLLEYKYYTGRPIYATIAHQGTSGAYYIAAAADEIYANRNSLTGSIGVIMGSSVDMTQLMDRLGIKMTTFHAGANKNMLSIDEPVTEEQAAIMQSLLTESYEQFVGIIAESRHMSVDDVRTLADGRIYTAQQALANGLIDGICPYEDALRKLADDTDVSYSNIYIYSYEDDNSFWEKMLDVHSLITDPISAELENIRQTITPPVSGPAYYCQF